MSDMESNVGVMQFAIMTAISRSPEKAYGTAIAKSVSILMRRDVTDGQVFLAIGRLERRGIIERVPAKKDGPRGRGATRKIVKLTASGEKELSRWNGFIRFI